MAKIDELIPFVLYFECGFDRSYVKLPLAELFEIAKKSGFSNDKADAGGATMCGVTIATYTSYRKKLGISTTTVADLKNISLSDWRSIIKTLFWDRWKADRIESQALANILVDWTWGSGSNGITIPQQILGVKVDGIVGDKTLAALNARNAEQLFNQIHNARINFVENIVRKKPSQRRFLKGWKRRINSITYNALRYDIDS